MIEKLFINQFVKNQKKIADTFKHVLAGFLIWFWISIFKLHINVFGNLTRRVTWICETIRLIIISCILCTRWQDKWWRWIVVFLILVENVVLSERSEWRWVEHLLSALAMVMDQCIHCLSPSLATQLSCPTLAAVSEGLSESRSIQLILVIIRRVISRQLSRPLSCHLRWFDMYHPSACSTYFMNMHTITLMETRSVMKSDQIQWHIYVQWQSSNWDDMKFANVLVGVGKLISSGTMCETTIISRGRGLCRQNV